jgi:glycosyltransferase involved in cell wall biosynthesis
MNVLYILPGSGGSFYCQNCLRDTAIAEALRGQGHSVTLLPLYLPATMSMPRPTDVPVFYGAVSLYLRHRFAVLRHLPRAWFAPLDRWPVLRVAARFAGTTSARGLEDLTLSMLRGADGQQAEELARVCEWLQALPPDERPDAIILSNALLAGLAVALKAAAHCPVLCWLQDEHVWFDAMAPDLRQAVIEMIAADARAIDRFVAVSRYYAQEMAQAIGLSPGQVAVVHPGLDSGEYRAADVTRRPRTIGFLSRLAPAEGFDRFVEAFLLLRREPRFADVRLAATGGPPAERGFLRHQKRRLEWGGAGAVAEISTSRFVADRVGFLAELTLLSVPGGSTPEAFGYYAIEAMAAGVPVVLPRQGAFPEIAAAAGCGILADDARSETLARAWAALLDDPVRLQRESAQGRRAAETVFAHAFTASALARVLKQAGATGLDAG